jgi:hypothetical protein
MALSVVGRYATRSYGMNRRTSELQIRCSFFGSHR